MVGGCRGGSIGCGNVVLWKLVMKVADTFVVKYRSISFGGVRSIALMASAHFTFF